MLNLNILSNFGTLPKFPTLLNISYKDGEEGKTRIAKVSFQLLGSFFGLLNFVADQFAEDLNVTGVVKLRQPKNNRRYLQDTSPTFAHVSGGEDRFLSEKESKTSASFGLTVDLFANTSGAFEKSANILIFFVSAISLGVYNLL